MEFTKGASSHIEEGKAAEAGASTEERYLALSQWWQRHCKAFSLWFLSLPATQQQVVLQRCCPDIPKSSGRAAARASSSGGADAGGVIPSLKATDIILPELSLESLLASNGRLLILFVTRICTSPSKMMREDIQFLTTLHSTSLLPSLSNNAFVSLDCPFVDPLDAEENVQALPKDASELNKKELKAHLETGRLVHAEVWLALKVRQAAVVSFIVRLAEEHQREAVDKPSPTFAALLRGEIQQKKNSI